jgi:hypothetical protein
LTGVTPPYQHFEPSLNKLEYDWRWAAGATPFGPYSNYEGVSEIMQVQLHKQRQEAKRFAGCSVHG